MKTIGILAMQGGIEEHENILATLKVKTLRVKTAEDLDQIDGLIIPGGESTAIGLLLELTGLMQAIKARAQDPQKPLPIWGTCAGAILLAKNIESEKIPPHLGLMDITIQRNAYGKQADSFDAELNITAAKITKLHAAFIRAPIITKVGPTVQILATHNQKIVLVQQGTLLASTFHPELCGDPQLHRYFLGLDQTKLDKNRFGS